jgi:ribosomal protein S18 acetylase RimI-like enzyme
MALPDRYRIVEGHSRDRALLLKFMQDTYAELFPEQRSFVHLAQTVDRYLSPETPIWWVEAMPWSGSNRPLRIANLWLGNAIDPVTGESYAHILTLYVQPAHRRQGLATALLQQAQNWAKKRGNRQIGLQVYSHNQPAQILYRRLGFTMQSLCLIKLLPAGVANVHPLDS